MIIAIVRIPFDGDRAPRDAVIEGSLKSTPIYREVKGLISKHYLMGDATNGGVYMFDTRENADAWYHEGWADWMEGRFGVRPTLEIFDNAVIVDNVAGEVRVDDKVLAEA
jgi:hypothetical protein